MQVILLDKVENLGSLGDLVEVKPGFARNFLLPGGHAKPATSKNVKEFDDRRAELEIASGDRLTAAQGRANQLTDVSVVITAKAGTGGKLFGSIGSEVIAEAVTQAGFKIAKREVRLREGPLRTLGEHIVDLHLHTDVDATVAILVQAEQEQ